MRLCPVCSVRIAEPRLMCRPHWQLVPHELQGRVYFWFRRAPGGDEHVAACAEAVAHVRRELRAAAERMRARLDELRTAVRR